MSQSSMPTELQSGDGVTLQWQTSLRWRSGPLQRGQTGSRGRRNGGTGRQRAHGPKKGTTAAQSHLHGAEAAGRLRAGVAATAEATAGISHARMCDKATAG